MRKVMVAKLHGLCVTQCELLYTGSIVIPPQILSDSNIGPGDVVSIYNFNNGAHYDTYVIAGKDNSNAGKNGPFARAR